MGAVDQSQVVVPELSSDGAGGGQGGAEVEAAVLGIVPGGVPDIALGHGEAVVGEDGIEVGQVRAGQQDHHLAAPLQVVPDHLGLAGGQVGLGLVEDQQGAVVRHPVVQQEADGGGRQVGLADGVGDRAAQGALPVVFGEIEDVAVV